MKLLEKEEGLHGAKQRYGYRGGGAVASDYSSATLGLTNHMPPDIIRLELPNLSVFSLTAISVSPISSSLCLFPGLMSAS